jgi:hypothetical protein
VKYVKQYGPDVVEDVEVWGKKVWILFDDFLTPYFQGSDQLQGPLLTPEFSAGVSG